LTIVTLRGNPTTWGIWDFPPIKKNVQCAAVARKKEKKLGGRERPGRGVSEFGAIGKEKKGRKKKDPHETPSLLCWFVTRQRREGGKGSSYEDTITVLRGLSRRCHELG